jgi:hypothetical protein
MASSRRSISRSSQEPGALELAAPKQRPTLDLAAGKLVLDETLPLVLSYLGKSLEELGWERIDDTTLTIPITAGPDGADGFLLRLCFLTGRAWPPSAQFVNPETLEYDLQSDQEHLPKLQSGQVQTHSSFDSPDGKKLQLICCSATLEFYEVLHDVQPQHVWKDTDTFLVTITAIQRAMNHSYLGRFDA